MDANFSLFSGSLVTTCSILGILGTVLRAMVTVSLSTVTGIPYISCLGSVRRGLSNSGSYSSSNLTSFRFLLFEGRRYANLATSRVAHKIDLLIDVTLRPDFTGAGRSGLTQGRLRNPDNPDHLSQTPQSPGGLFTSVHVYIGTYPRRVAFAALGYEAQEEFCHRIGVLFHRNRCSIGMSCAQAPDSAGRGDCFSHTICWKCPQIVHQEKTRVPITPV